MSNGRTDSSTVEWSLAQAIQQRCNESEILELIENTDITITDQSGKSALLYAIQCNNKNIVNALIEAGADVNIIDRESKTALFYAIHSKNYKSAIDALSAAGAAVNTESRNGKTPLIYAIAGNNESVVQTLIDAGADVNKRYKDLQTPLIYAVREGKSESVLKVLIDAGADVNLVDKDGKTALFYAVQQQNKKRVIEALIDAGADVNISDHVGKTALFYAIKQNNSESVVQVLIDHGVDVNKPDNDDETVLLDAVRENDCESLVTSLIAAGADVNFSSKNNHTALCSAVQRRGHESLVRTLIKAGAKVNQDGRCHSPLFHAVSSENESMVQVLIDAGADVNVTNDDDQSPMFYAALHRKESIIHILIDAGAEVNLSDKLGETPFIYALTGESFCEDATLIALISRGANVRFNKNGKTALLWAIERGQKESVVRAMLKAGADADVNKTDNDNKTPLYNAICRNRHKGVISALIDAGSDVNLNAHDGGETVLARAIRSAGPDVVCKLVNAGAHVNVTDSDGAPILFHVAAHFYKNNVVKMMVDAGADIKAVDKNGQTVLFHVVQHSSDGEKTRELIDLGAEVNKRDYSGKTVLFYAAQTSNDSLVRTLLAAGADVHASDSDGQTALHHAVQHEHSNEKVVRELIDAGADVNTPDRYGYPALFHALQKRNNESIVKALIDASADVNVTLADGQTPLFLAAQQFDNEGMVQAIIDAGADVSITDKYGRSALFYSVQRSTDRLGVVRALIEANNDTLNLKDIYGRTAMFYVNFGSRGLASYLVEKNAECLHLKDNCNVDVLTFAIDNISQTGLIRDTMKYRVLQEFTKTGIIRRESLAKAIINVMFRKYVSEVLRNPQHSISYQFEDLSRSYVDTLANDVLQRTRKMKELMGVFKDEFHNVSKALQLLVELGADPDSADSQGNTALHLTAASPFQGASHETVMDLCKHLRKYEVRFNARNHQNQTPLMFCISQIPENKLQSAIKTFVRVCRFLVANGSNIEEASRNGETVFHGVINVFQWSLQLQDKAERKEALNYSIEFLELFIPAKSTSAIVNKTDVFLKAPLHLWASLALSSPQDYPTQLTDKHTFESILKLILDSLIDCGATVNVRNNNDKTPLHLCKTWCAAKMLIKAGANVSDVDSSGRTVLLAAAKKKLFLERPDCFYPDISEEPKSFWKSALQMGLDPFTTDKQDESVVGVLVASENFILSQSLIDVMTCEESSIQSGNVLSILNAICKDTSTKTSWKTGLVQDILKSAKSVISAAAALHFCCENAVSTTPQQVEKAIPMEVSVDEDGDDSPRPKRRRVDPKVEEVGPDASTVHLENIKILRCYGAANDEECQKVADEFPSLKRFLTSALSVEEIPKLIPWTSVSRRHEDKLAKVCRRQSYDMIADEYWYHKDPVGTGSFGSIFVGLNVKDGREVAVKRIERVRMHRPEEKREIQSLTTLAYCEQVVRYLNYFEEKEFAYIVLELMEGNLDEYFSDVSAFNAKRGTDLCLDIVKGLKHLHSNDILHRDLKPQNILYKTHPKVCLKIADFGLSRRLDSTSATVYGTNAGTRCWMAPECLRDSKDHSKKSDMFSCGLLFHFILSKGKHPFCPADSAAKSLIQVARKTEANIEANKKEGWDTSVSAEATHLIEWMLKSEEKERATAEEALKHPFCYSRKKKIDFIAAVANQEEFGRSLKTPLTTAFDTKASTIIKHGKWDDSSYLHMPAIYAEMTKSKKFRRGYRTSSAVDLVRFVRNTYQHVSDVMRPAPIRKMVLEDFVFLEYFPNLVIEVYKAVTTHGWDQSREEIKYVMKN